MGLLRPATINQEFDAVVHEMEKSSKVHEKSDPVEEKLTEILKVEEIVITSKLEMTLEEVKRLYQDEGKSQGYIAEYYGVEKSEVNSFLSNHKLFRKTLKSDDGFLDK